MALDGAQARLAVPADTLPVDHTLSRLKVRLAAILVTPLLPLQTMSEWRGAHRDRRNGGPGDVRGSREWTHSP